MVSTETQASETHTDATAQAVDPIAGDIDGPRIDPEESHASSLRGSTARAVASGSIASRRSRVRSDLLTRSRTIQSPNFLRATATDLKLLFDLYDQHFFDRALSTAHRAATSTPLTFDWSGRLRSSGGVTSRLRDRRGKLSFKITISRPLIFDNFKDDQPHVVVGVPCTDRLDALMRIFEHELLHLHEFLAFGNSSCARPRFQKLAEKHFGHAEHKHRLTTPRERVLKATTLRPGMAVTFIADGQTLRGRINRIHNRATVLVPSPKGRLYTDGKRYLKFYIPLALLRPATDGMGP